MKKNSLAYIIIILVIILGIGYFAWMKNHYISKQEALSIADPIIKKCWVSTEANKIEVESLTAALIDRQVSLNPEVQKYWRVGVVYSTTDQFGMVRVAGGSNDIAGNIPEVFINAKTGEVAEKHFTELGSVSPECR